MGDDDAIVVDGNAAAFLSPVLEGIQGSISTGGNMVGLVWVVNPKHATFFMEFVEQIFSPRKLKQFPVYVWTEKPGLFPHQPAHDFLISVLYIAHVPAETILIQLFMGLFVPQAAGVGADFIG